MCTSWKFVKYHHSNIEEALANALKCLGYQRVNVVAINTKQFYVIIICMLSGLTTCLWPVLLTSLCQECGSSFADYAPSQWC